MRASVEPGDWDGGHKQALISWVLCHPSRSRAGTGAERHGIANSAPLPPATKSAGPRVWASTSVSTPKCWSRNSGLEGRWAESPRWAATGARGESDAPCLHSTRIFGFEGADAEDVIYVNWLNMVRAGLLALEFYTPEAANWRQVRILGARMAQVHPLRQTNLF